MTARGASAATSAARARTPGSKVTIARCPSSGSTIVTGVRAHGAPTTATPSSWSTSRIMPPAGSGAIGEASATESPSRAAPMAVIAPPPGERTRSPAKRSSPSRGSASRPTKVMSMNAGTAMTTSTLMRPRLSGSAAKSRTHLGREAPDLLDHVAFAPQDEAVEPELVAQPLQLLDPVRGRAVQVPGHRAVGDQAVDVGDPPDRGGIASCALGGGVDPPARGRELLHREARDARHPAVGQAVHDPL